MDYEFFRKALWMGYIGSIINGLQATVTLQPGETPVFDMDDPRTKGDRSLCNSGFEIHRVCGWVCEDGGRVCEDRRNLKYTPPSDLLFQLLSD